MSVTLTQTRVAASPAAPAPAPAPAPFTPATPLKSTTHIKIDQEWYDLTYWKKSHPGGALILEQMNGNDATDAFYSLHSEEAVARLRRLPHSTALPAALAAYPPPPPTKAATAFRAFRAELAKEGYFKRTLAWDVFYTLSVYALAALGTWACMAGYKLVAVVLIGFAMQQAGWIGHDYIHGRNKACEWNGYFMVGLINGFSRSWWSNKHNTHHVFTNYIGVDADIENDPVFHLFFPESKDDTMFRRMQHWYFVPVASILYISWRTQSLLNMIQQRQWTEVFFMLINYTWLYQLGFPVALGSIYLGGMLVATIVTATHQSEEMIDPLAPAAPAAYSFCEGQFATTRDASTNNFFMEWLWGGMQYQLEHHLFPTMPKYYYAAIAPRVRAFAQANGLEYRVDTQTEIFQRNFNTLKFFAQDKAPEHNKGQ